MEGYVQLLFLAVSSLGSMSFGKTKARKSRLLTFGLTDRSHIGVVLSTLRLQKNEAYHVPFLDFSCSSWTFKLSTQHQGNIPSLI
ncbi:hypothetical protein K438DRAFT_410566 [Mycena galopus ATCC 62051]|nr:hypothetical protein K438DRAFT_410566 [Mycena galopus ATCC 62051]